MQFNNRILILMKVESAVVQLSSAKQELEAEGGKVRDTSSVPL